MYGTVATMRVKPGSEPALVALMDEWVRDRKPHIEGSVGGYVLRPDDHPDVAILVAIFKDRATYRANANDPEQDRWYKRLREHLEADPTWTDGEIIQTS
jgi:quinol monooxygenase YgiN